MKAFFLQCLLVAFSAQVNAQERYVQYSRDDRNRDLYDTQIYSFYSMAVITGMRITEEYMVEEHTFSGMRIEDLHRLEAQEGRRWDQIPEVKVALGPQSTAPMMNVYGEDSVEFLPAGTTQYLYAPRDSIFFMSRQCDDFVLKQVLVKDPVTGAESWKNETIYLRKQLFENEDPVVVLSFPWDCLFEIDKQYYMPLQNNSLETQLVAFLEEGERRYGERGGFQYFHRGSLWQYSYPFASRFATYDREQETWNKLLHAGEENGVCLKTRPWTMPLATVYGEDSVAFDPDGDLYYVMPNGLDSSLYLKSHFGKPTELHVITYVGEKGWKSSVEAIAFVKNVLPNEMPLFTYRTERRKGTNYEYTGESLKAFNYVQEQDPLRKYIEATPVETIGPLEWEALSGQNRFLGVVVPEP